MTVQLFFFFGCSASRICSKQHVALLCGSIKPFLHGFRMMRLFSFEAILLFKPIISVGLVSDLPSFRAQVLDIRTRI